MSKFFKNFSKTLFRISDRILEAKLNKKNPLISCLSYNNLKLTIPCIKHATLVSQHRTSAHERNQNSLRKKAPFSLDRNR